MKKNIAAAKVEAQQQQQPFLTDLRVTRCYTFDVMQHTHRIIAI